MPRKQTIKKSALIPTVLISGGAGFIGSHLAEALLKNNARVVVLDNFNTGKEVHVNHLLKNPNFALYDIDINEGLPTDIESVDYIFHLAGLEEYIYSRDFLNLDVLLTNSHGIKHLLDLAERSDAKFLLASTTDVYQGRMSQLEIENYFGFAEKSSVDSLDNMFGLTEAKRFAEALVWEYYKKNNTDVRIVRLPEVYGPRMNLEASGHLGRFMKEVIEGNTLTIYGSGEEKENYLYIADVVSGLIKSLFTQETKGNIYSLVPDKAITVLETAYLVKSLADGKVDIKFKSAKDVPVVASKSPDTFNLKDLNWSPIVNFKDGITSTLKWFGYEVNPNSFKPLKLVDKKLNPEKEKIFSIQGSIQSLTPSNTKAIPVFPSKNVSTEKSLNPIKLKNNSKPALPVNTSFKIKKSPMFRLPKLFSGLPKLGPQAQLIFNIGAVFVAALLVFIAFPLGGLIFNLNVAKSSGSKLKDYLMKGNISEAERYSVKTFDSLSNASEFFYRTKWMYKIVGKEGNYKSLESLLRSATNFCAAGYSVSSGVKPLLSLWDILRPDTSMTLNPDDFERASLNLSEAKKLFGIADAELSNVVTEDVPEPFRNELSIYRNIMGKVNENFDFVDALLTEMPNILGSKEEKVYIIWFQNSNEIRPTGGFIGSYGVLTLKDGKIKDLQIDDIYNPDGQIDVRNIKVDPPAQIATFLNEDRLYLRNSNWSPDFTNSVLSFEDLYFKVTGKKVDGFIALDLNFVQKVLNATGPVFLSAYNEEISAENLYERAQYYSSFDYKNGSDQKRSFLTVLGNKLLEKLFALDNEGAAKILLQVFDALNERHLLVYFSNSPLNAFLKEKRWDGSLVDTQKDYLYVVNSNLGGTKSNYYIKNKMTYEVKSLTRDGLLRANVYLDYEHTGKDNSWPGGPYTDYVRVLTQNGTKLTGAKIIYDDGKEEDLFNKIVTSKVGKYTSFETSFKLDPSRKIRLVISYDLPVSLSLTKNFKEYNLTWQKQPGTFNDDFIFKFSPPFGMVSTLFSPDLKQTDTGFESNGLLNMDKDYYVLFN